VSSDSHSSGSDFLSLIDHSTIEGSNGFFVFLSRLLEKLGENVSALVAIFATKMRTSMRVAPRPKNCPMLKKKCSPPISRFLSIRGLMER